MPLTRGSWHRLFQKGGAGQERWARRRDGGSEEHVVREPPKARLRSQKLSPRGVPLAPRGRCKEAARGESPQTESQHQEGGVETSPSPCPVTGYSCYTTQSKHLSPHSMPGSSREGGVDTGVTWKSTTSNSLCLRLQRFLSLGVLTNQDLNTGSF